MTAIALMICRFEFTRLSYHTDHIELRRPATSAQPPGKPHRYSSEAH
jgi:hypothetical protein